MPSYHEPIFHDRQDTTDQSGVMTSSSSFVDIADAMLTTKNLSDDGNYLITFSFIVQASQANTLASFQVLLDGTPLGAMDRTLAIKTNNQDIGVTLTGYATGITPDDELQVQWKTDKGTLTMAEFTLLIDGIPADRLVE